MARVHYLEFCLPHSASVLCAPGPVRLGTQSPLCLALSQTTLPFARLAPLPSAPPRSLQGSPASDPRLRPSPSSSRARSAWLTHWTTLCGGAWSLGTLPTSTAGWSVLPEAAWPTVLLNLEEGLRNLRFYRLPRQFGAQYDL